MASPLFGEGKARHRFHHARAARLSPILSPFDPHIVLSYIAVAPSLPLE